MSVKLVSLDEDSLYEHIFERYVELGRHTESLKQDLGIQQRDASTLEIDIEPPLPSVDSIKPRKRKGSKRTEGERYNILVEQSLSDLNSSVSNNNSTTGYVLWSSTPFFLRWLLYNPEAQPFREGSNVVEIMEREGTATIPSMYSSTSARQESVGILELGTGISPLMASVLCNHVSAYVCTDQRGILNRLKYNLKENLSQITRRQCISATLGIESEIESAAPENDDGEEMYRTRRKPMVQLEVQELDWEKFDAKTPHPYLDQLSSSCGTVYILAMDVIYNEYLIDPFLNTLSALRNYFSENNITVSCLVGVHLRSQDIVTQFLEQAVIEHELPVQYIHSTTIEESRYALYLVN